MNLVDTINLIKIKDLAGLFVLSSSYFVEVDSGFLPFLLGLLIVSQSKACRTWLIPAPWKQSARENSGRLAGSATTVLGGEDCDEIKNLGCNGLAVAGHAQPDRAGTSVLYASRRW